MQAVESQIEQVTVYARGARVRRIAMLAGAVPARVRLAGLPIAVIDGTVRAEVDGPAVVTAVRAGVAAPEPAAAAAEQAPALRAVHRRVPPAETEVERLARALARLAQTPN